MIGPSEDKHFPIKVGAKARTLHVDYLARVEGEGSLHIEMKGDKVQSATLNIFEPPRFFEALLQGRPHTDAPDITARICGICPVAYQMSAVYAMEDALSLTLPEYIHQLRRLIYCGEWIESHALHIYMLHAPDFLKEPDAIALAKKDPAHIRRGLKIKKGGNRIIQLLGGREIHPINVKVGGFFKLPTKNELEELKKVLVDTRSDALEGLHWVAGFSFPIEEEKKYELVSLHHEKEYPMARGDIACLSGKRFSSDGFLKHIQEEHVKGSTALYAHMNGKPYLVGPLARFNLHHHLLPSALHSVMDDIKFTLPCFNPYKSIIIRSLEILFAIDEAIRIIDAYTEQDSPPSVAYTAQAGTGYAVSEAPRGLLYHHYHLDDKGMISEAKIIPPTSQNQKMIEHDLLSVARKYAKENDDILRYQCEMAIRNFDPCISCATHFLSLRRTYG